ncbi:hypothetical protein SAMN05421820_105170 [Pedobacter steynii]|uniref:Uncharacterized protein n=1 Tax=Pedobacter steynii TaxID=430522 RepID=A0A1G9WHD6_9SPHI|nr:hypothetical protein [Pedobacter steynii]NQX40294.1 hypothetical protein [Pedobacter steynii]SDM83747.1 hypothetical protein SAMN05421820_105170 [Pedobacter steynii]
MELLEIRNAPFDSIYIVENRNLWEGIQINKSTDLVLCIDFGLYHQLKSEGVNVAYLDHLTDTETANQFNAEMNHYLQNWFRDGEGNDLLNYQGYDIGDALLLDILNDITYPCHFILNLIALRKLKYKKLIVASQDVIINSMLTRLGIDYSFLSVHKNALNKPVYNFPIIKWTNEQINSVSFKSKIKKTVSGLLDRFLAIYDNFRGGKNNAVFIQNYHPTESVIHTLIDEKQLKVVLNDYIPGKKIFSQRRFEIKNYRIEQSDQIVHNYTSAIKTNWIYENINLSEILEERLIINIKKNIDRALAQINNINAYFSRKPIKLLIPVTNLWLNNRLVMHYCKNNNIPIFMIINGLLNARHWQDAHDSTWVNCYSESLKMDYFGNKNNALPLGDPRMDSYAKSSPKVVNRKSPNILIGAAAYSHLDQTSYVAFEFDFLFDVLKALTDLGHTNYSITLKVRANGYANLYQDFLREYFPHLNVTVIQDTPFSEVVSKADLYISFYSQTLMEAAVLGIPTIYYKKDDADLFRPYDCKSELVTALNIEELSAKIEAFYLNDSIFNKFMDRSVLERYIGPLDGKNLERNVDFIYSILNVPRLNRGI